MAIISESTTTNTMSPEREHSTNLVLCSHEFPNDDVQELFRSLQRHTKKAAFPLLAAFLKECTNVLREEVLKLPQSQQALLPPFQRILDLAGVLGELKRNPLGVAVEGALLCILEIGMLIGHYEGQNLEYKLPAENTTTYGISIGLFAAAAISTSSSLWELANTGAEAARITFRFCVHVDVVSQQLEPRDAQGNPESWAYVVTGISKEDVQIELDRYNSGKFTPELTKLRISHADKGSVGVTGHPSRLRDLFRSSQVLRHSKYSPLAIFGGLCHAAGVYSEDDVSAIMEGMDLKLWGSHPVRLPLLSPHTGLPFAADNASHLYQLICREALFKPLFQDRLISGILASISAPDIQNCNILVYRTSIISSNILSEITSNLPNIRIKRHDLIDWAGKEFEGSPSSTKDSKLAVVGMSCRLPGGANDAELFWKLMVEGRDVHTKIPLERFDLETHYDPTGKTENATETPFGNFIESPGLFDAAFFNMSPREAEQTDPMHRLALVTAYEALEMSGFAPNRTPSTNLKRIGTFYGVASDDYREVNAGQSIGTYGIPGGERAFANGRINYFFKFGGPSFNIDTACSSGGAAINAACSSLWSNEADMVVAGGLNIISNPDIYCMLSKGHFLSKTGQCKVWDKDADGYCRADGIGSVVIKRLEDAIADNDNIIGSIVSAATNHSAEAISITHPHAGAQRDNYTQVMNNAGISPLDVSYVELHGTGTQAGDAVESESVADIFAPLSPGRHVDNTLHLGALKSNIGHSEAAAGVASLIKVLLAFQKSEIPRNIGIRTEINPVVAKNIHKRNATMATDNIAWDRVNGKTRYAIANSFGAHGGNTTFLLQEAPEKVKTGEDPRLAHVVSVSAKSKASLRANLQALSIYLDRNPEASLGDLSYTTCARRIHHHTRVATSVSNIPQLQKFLRSTMDNVDSLRAIPATAPPIAFAFTGQGAFYDGVGSALFRDFPFYQKEILRLDRIAQQSGFPSILPAIEGALKGDHSPLVAQLTIVISGIALVRFWELLGVKPSVVVGHSLGEYAAMVAAGVLSSADAIFLAGKRAELLINTCTAGGHAMMSVHASVETIKKFSGENSYEIACMNGETDTVISGSLDEMAKIRSELQSHDLKCLKLDIPFAFHSTQLDPILDPFERTAESVFFKPPSIPIISPLLGQCVFDGKTINANYLRRASREPVNFFASLESAREMGIIDDRTVWIDIGPHPICQGFVHNHAPAAKTFPSLRRNEDNWVTVTATLAGLHYLGFPISWNEYFKVYEKSYTLLHPSPYKWNEKNYWVPYIGTWTLDKAHIQSPNPRGNFSSQSLALKSSSVQYIISEDFQDMSGQLVAVSDVMNSDLLSAVSGHLINGHGVVTASIWCDMALTVGEALYKGLVPDASTVPMNVTDMKVDHAQILQMDRSQSQLLQIEAAIDLNTQFTTVCWYNVSADDVRSNEPFATAKVLYEDPAMWQMEWRRMTHLLNDRIDALSRMAANGSANMLSKNMIYTLFGNVVDYADKYRGMQSVVLNGYEAFADIVLDPNRHGRWHTPPHWIDSVFQLAGFVMNGSDASNTKDFFCITPGWTDYRVIKPLEAGATYRSYVRMFPAEDEPNTFTGDIYATQDGVVIGMCSQITFKRVPRVLMSRLFVAPDAHKNSIKNQSASKQTAPMRSTQVSFLSRTAQTTTLFGKRSQERAAIAVTPPDEEFLDEALESAKIVKKMESETLTAALSQDSPMIVDCFKLIAYETGLGIETFTDDASFQELGVDSLMSLVLSEKFRSQLRLEVQSSIFLECPSVKDLKECLEQCF